VWKRRDAGPGPVTLFKYLTGPGDGLPALADLHQNTGDIAHHVQQEGIGLDFHDHKFALALDAQCPDIAHGCRRLAGSAPVRGEIAFAKQCLTSVMHALRIQPCVVVADQAAEYGRPYRIIVDHVTVTAGGRAEAGMKIRTHLSGPAYRHRGWQDGIATAHPGRFRPLEPIIEMHHLPCSVDTGIRAAGTG